METQQPEPIEPDVLEMNLVRGWLQPGQIAVDVGACTGLYTKLCADSVGPSGRVHAIEPDEDNFRKLVQYIGSHGLENVFMYRHAAASVLGECKLYRNPGHAGDHHTWNDPDDPREAVEVMGVPLDLLIPGSIQFLKIDVQGAELEVLRGAEKLLGRSPVLAVLIEWWPYGLMKNGQGSMDMIRWLIERGFDVHYVDYSAGGIIYKLDGEVDLLPDPDAKLADVWANLWCIRGVTMKHEGICNADNM